MIIKQHVTYYFILGGYVSNAVGWVQTLIRGAITTSLSNILSLNSHIIQYVLAEH